MNIHEEFFSRIGFSYLIFGLFALAVQILAINIIGFINLDIIYNFNILTILSAICNYVLPFPILYMLLKVIDTQPLKKQNLNIRTFLKYLAITLTLMWIGNIIGLLLTEGIGILMHSEISNPVENLISSADIWINLVLISIIAPIFEEIFFRKFLIDRTIKYGARVSIILSAILFGLFHGNLNQFFYAFLMGGFFAYVYMKTGKVIYTIGLHIIVNLLGSVVSLFVAGSIDTLVGGTIDPIALIIIFSYLGFFISAFIIGIVSIYKFKKSKLDEIKTRITMENPLKNIILNPGMIFFILFFTFEIVYQLIS